jgi:hypothetical protein
MFSSQESGTSQVSGLQPFRCMARPFYPMALPWAGMYRAVGPLNYDIMTY